MKQKAITIILTIIIILSSIIVVPRNIYEDSFMLKNIVLLIGGFLLFILVLASYKDLKIDAKDILLLVFLFLVFLSMLFCSEKPRALLGDKTRHEGLLMFTTYIIIYIASKKFFKCNNYKLFFNLIFYTSILIALLGVVQNFINDPNYYPILNSGISGTFVNSNFYGSYISIVLPISICSFLFNKSKKGIILSAILFFNLLTSGTRSAWVAFVFVALTILIYLQKNRKEINWKKVLILTILFIIITVCLLYILPDSYFKTKIKLILDDIALFKNNGLDNKLGSSRMEIWKMVIKLISKKPLLGCGPDNLAMGLWENCNEEFVAHIDKYNVFPDKAHNEYLQIAATLGIPALVVYLIFLGLILLPKTKLMFKNKVCFIFCLTILSYLIQAFFNISIISIAPFFWMILGLSDNESIKEYLNNNLDNK